MINIPETKLSNTSGYEATFSKTTIDKFRSEAILNTFRKHRKSVQLNLFDNLEIESKISSINKAKIDINQCFDIVNRFIEPNQPFKKENNVEFVNIARLKPGFELASLRNCDEPPSEIKEFKKYDSNHQIASLRSLVMQDYPIQTPKTKQVIELDFPLRSNSSRHQSCLDKEKTSLSTPRLRDSHNLKYRDCITIIRLSPQNKIKIKLPKVNNEINNEKILLTSDQQKKKDQSPKVKIIASNFSSKADFAIKSNPSIKGLHLRLKSGEESPEKLDVIGKKSLITPISSRKKIDFKKEFQISLFNFESVTSRSVGKKIPDCIMIPALNNTSTKFVDSRIKKIPQLFKSLKLHNGYHNLIRIDE